MPKTYSTRALAGLSMLAVEAGRPEKAQPSVFFRYRKPDLRLTKASAGRARRLEICIHLLSINRKRRTRGLLFSIAGQRISKLGRLKQELNSSSSCPTGRK